MNNTLSQRADSIRANVGHRAINLFRVQSKKEIARPQSNVFCLTEKKGEEMRPFEDLKISKGRGPSVDENSILNFEEQIGFKLPSSYVDLIMYSNGGHPELDTFSAEDDEWSVSRFFSIEPEDTSTENVIWNYRHNKLRGLPDSLLPIAGDGGGNLFYLDLAYGEKAPVLIFIHDHDIPTRKLQKLAETFADFIDGLHENPDYI